MSGLRLGDAASAAGADRPERGVRVILDVRPLQDPEHAPVTAAYLDGLLTALDAEPLEGESFVFLLAADLDDPTERYASLEVVGRRLLPPVRLLGSARSAIDPFLVRGASVGAAWNAERAGAAGSVHHTTGGALTWASELPVVVGLLDLAPWELPALRHRQGPAGFGRRLRARLIRDAAAVLVGTETVGRRARRLLRVREDRLHVVPLAPRLDPGAAAAARDVEAATSVLVHEERERLGLAERYLVLAAHYDARHDLRTLMAAVRSIDDASAAPAAGPDDGRPWLCLVGATPDDRAGIGRLAYELGVTDALAYARELSSERLAALLAGSRAVVAPVVADAAGLSVLDAHAAGVPVVASAVGALPELVGRAGILVPPGDPDRLVTALRTMRDDDVVRDPLVTAARERAGTLPAWSDVALATRGAWARVARRSRLR